MALLLLLAAALLLPALGKSPIERAEIYFMDGARSMVERGDYLVPRYNGEPFFDKPPLTYWLMAASFRLFGFTETAARLVAVAAALGLLAVTVGLGERLFDVRTSLAGGAVLASTLAFMTFGRIAMSDMLLALWTNLAFWVAVRAWVVPSRAWAPPALAALLGLAFLTKGPIGLLLPGIGIAILAYARREQRPRWSATVLVAAALIFGVVGLGWFLAVLVREGTAPLAHFFLRENLERFASEAYDAGQPPWFYLGAYLLVGMPWSPFLGVAATRVLDRGREPACRLLFGWLALMVVALSLSRGKVDYYLLPVYPAASLLIGRYLVCVPWDRRDRILVRGVLLILAASFGFVPFLSTRIPAGWLPGHPAQVITVAMSALGAVAILWAAWRPDGGRVLLTVGGSATLLFLLTATVFLPALRTAQPNEAILRDVRREHLYRPDARLVVCRDAARVQRDLLFRERMRCQERCDLWSHASSPLPFLMLLQSNEYASLATIPRLRLISEHQALPGRDLTLRGLLRGPQPERVIVVANYTTTDPVAEAKRKKERRKAILADEEEAGAPPDPR
jgi:4-amino-4-deoxy-L-arabinose transferase-like glycosyltransferase